MSPCAHEPCIGTPFLISSTCLHRCCSIYCDAVDCDAVHSDAVDGDANHCNASSIYRSITCAGSGCAIAKPTEKQLQAVDDPSTDSPAPMQMWEG